MYYREIFPYLVNSSDVNKSDELLINTSSDATSDNPETLPTNASPPGYFYMLLPPLHRWFVWRSYLIHIYFLVVKVNEFGVLCMESILQFLQQGQEIPGCRKVVVPDVPDGTVASLTDLYSDGSNFSTIMSTLTPQLQPLL